MKKHSTSSFAFQLLNEALKPNTEKFTSLILLKVEGGPGRHQNVGNKIYDRIPIGSVTYLQVVRKE